MTLPHYCGRQGHLRRRERELLAGNNRRWAQPLPGPLELTGSFDWQFARGFVAAITCTAADWLAHHKALAWHPDHCAWACPATAQPIGRVRLTTRPEIRPGGCLRWTEPEERGGVRLYAQWDVAVDGRVEQFNLRSCVAKEFAAAPEPRAEFDRRVDASRTPEGYFAARWPWLAVELPPDPSTYAANADWLANWVPRETLNAFEDVVRRIGGVDTDVELRLVPMGERTTTGAEVHFGR